ncbi:MAG: octaprenyl diphosphate synthase [Oxalobacter sp.]|nr:MAG: octaprenyl diphosphate synthase [Oxalobacter sp.]
MASVDRIIREQLHSDVALINQIGEYIVNAGGKRIRPSLLLLFAKALGYSGEHHHTLAAMIELIHTSTLLHDDVVDESSLRRGQPTANALFGNAASVLVGDFIYTRTFQMMLAVENMRIMHIMANATNIIAEGEVMQLMSLRDASVTEAQYMQVIHAKTAALFEAATTIGALIAGAPEPTITAAAEYGKQFGIAFQLVDDALDYTGNADDIGKSLGDDLREGKMTLPLIRLMQTGTDKQAQLVRQCIENGNNDNFDAIVEALSSSDSIQYARGLAQHAAQAAARAITPLPHSQFKETLLELAAFAADRNH